MRINSKEHQLLLLEAVKVKLASVTRGYNTNSNPKFRALFQAEIDEYRELEQEVRTAAIGITDDIVKKPTK